MTFYDAFISYSHAKDIPIACQRLTCASELLKPETVLKLGVVRSDSRR